VTFNQIKAVAFDPSSPFEASFTSVASEVTASSKAFIKQVTTFEEVKAFVTFIAIQQVIVAFAKEYFA
jgi:hypothetical protein